MIIVYTAVARKNIPIYSIPSNWNYLHLIWLVLDLLFLLKDDRFDQDYRLLYLMPMFVGICLFFMLLIGEKSSIILIIIYYILLILTFNYTDMPIIGGNFDTDKFVGVMLSFDTKLVEIILFIILIIVTIASLFIAIFIGADTAGYMDLDTRIIEMFVKSGNFRFKAMKNKFNYSSKDIKSKVDRAKRDRFFVNIPKLGTFEIVKTSESARKEESNDLKNEEQKDAKTDENVKEILNHQGSSVNNNLRFYHYYCFMI